MSSLMQISLHHRAAGMVHVGNEVSGDGSLSFRKVLVLSAELVERIVADEEEVARGVPIVPDLGAFENRIHAVEGIAQAEPRRIGVVVVVVRRARMADFIRIVPGRKVFV